MIQTFALGALIGGIFTLARFPIPAPSNLAGIAGVVGLYAGAIIVGRFI